MKTKPDENLNCVEMKRAAQARIYRDIKNLTPEQEVAYFARKVEGGPLADWWKKASRKSTRKPASPASRR